MIKGTAAGLARYSYDPLGRLAQLSVNEQAGGRRFYRAQRFISECQSDTGISIVRAGNQLLGQHMKGAAPQCALIAADGQQSVLAVSNDSGSSSFSF